MRLPEDRRADLAGIERLPLRTEDGAMLALGQIAKVKLVDQPVQIARETLSAASRFSSTCEGGIPKAL